MYKNKIVFPLTTFGKIEAIILALNKKEDLTREELSELTKLGESNISNTLPILKELDYVRGIGVRAKRSRLTQDGQELVRALTSKNREGIKQVTLPHINRSKTLSEAFLLINQGEQLTSDKLGRLVANKFDKRFKNPITYASLGRSLFSILNGFGIISEELKTFKRKTSTFSRPEKNKFIPSSRAEKIFDTIEKLSQSRFKRLWKVDESKETIGHHKAKLKNLINLGLVRVNEKDEFRLKYKGATLKKSFQTGDTSNAFRAILLDYKPAFNFIRELSLLEKFSSKEIGENLANFNESNLKEGTQEWYGKNVLDWMKKAGLVEDNGEYGKYKIKENIKTLFIRSDKIRATLDDPDFPIIKDILLVSLSRDKLPSQLDRVRIDEYFETQITQSGNDKIALKSIKYLLDYAYQYNDIDPIKKATDLLVSVKMPEEVSE